MNSHLLTHSLIKRSFGLYKRIGFVFCCISFFYFVCLTVCLCTSVFEKTDVHTFELYKAFDVLFYFPLWKRNSLTICSWIKHCIIFTFLFFKMTNLISTSNLVNKLLFVIKLNDMLVMRHLRTPGIWNNTIFI